MIAQGNDTDVEIAGIGEGINRTSRDIQKIIGDGTGPVVIVQASVML